MSCHFANGALPLDRQGVPGLTGLEADYPVGHGHFCVPAIYPVHSAQETSIQSAFEESKHANGRNHMHKIVIGVAIAVLAVGTAAATEQTDVMLTVHQFIDGFNKGDAKMMVAACADQASIIDEFPPHEWHGAGACSKWLSDFDADAKKSDITDGSVTLGNARHVDVTADRAYVVALVDYTFKEKGKVNKETGSIITIALQKGGAGWRITGWAWAKH
jgi:hypothetical protein